MCKVHFAACYRMITYQFKQCINFHECMCNLWVVWDCAHLSVSGWHVWGDNLFCDPNLCVERLPKNHTPLPKPSHPISQLITVSAISYCMCVCEGSAADKSSALSILSRGDVLKGALLLINAWEPKEKENILQLWQNKKERRFWRGGKGEGVQKPLLVSILSDATCARSYVLNERRIVYGQLPYLLFAAPVRNTGGEINGSHLWYILEQLHAIHVQKRKLNNCSYR